ncbi:FtsX-like permease family protein [Leucobacter sp. UCMA 4100]|uniref:ABC transporter permease n=1 Tax=Leucobacter sp. UCMA 4100 TaxID=2810534 RepID=UPI0022EB8BBE|nr:FtsX-like permease family protein [Leucobacter sp. UCMA 4100]MDA3147970.1 FtsX-like permease family protein [Leucobacter sp. UCMA 4100]
MKLVTLAGLKAHWSRLVAVGVAVILAVAFMAATLLLDASSKATLKSTVGASYATADVVVENTTQDGMGFSLSADIVDTVTQTPGVELAAGYVETMVAIESDASEVPTAMLRERLPEKLEPGEVSDGRLPEHAGEVAIDADSLKRLGVGLGDELRVKVETYGDDGAATISRYPLAIVGITKPSQNPAPAGLVNLIATSDGVEATVGVTAPQRVLVLLDETTTKAEFAAALGQLEVPTFSEEEGEEPETEFVYPRVSTPDEMVDRSVNSMTNDSAMLTAVLLAFAGISLFVAGLVISNTFSVLVAQRSRELALLRCVGASSRQVRGAVLVEALVMAVTASVIGVGLAFGLMSGLVWAAGAMGIAGGVGVFAWSWIAVVAPIIAGVLVTLIAAQGPAREATRVAPLEALRSREAETGTRRGSRVRLTLGLLLALAGLAVVIVGMRFDDPMMSLGAVLTGSAVSAVGLLMLIVFIVPPIAQLLGRIFFSRGVPGKLAAANSVRNPKRTAATASALLVGVTLVATVYTGAEVARTTLSAELENSFPVDLVVVSYPQDLPGVELREDGEAQGEAEKQNAEESFGEVVKHLSAASGVTRVTQAQVQSLGEGSTPPLLELWGIDSESFSLVTRDKKAVLKAGEALIGSEVESPTVDLVGPETEVTVPASRGGAPSSTAVVTPELFAKIAGDGLSERLAALITIEDGLTNEQLVQLRDELSHIEGVSYVEGEVFERLMYDSIITTLLLIVTGLLAVAVIIAVIGIGNTLSLSVLERTRENALLRALGLTKGQLKGMLAIEALITAFAASVLGVLLGVGYGFAGATAVLSPFGHVEYVVPWVAIAVIVVAALLAGLAASVLPARRAVRLSPVEGLAVV